jgi:hypothetical protein
MEKIAPTTTNSDIKRFDRRAATYNQSILQRLYFVPVHSKALDLLIIPYTATRKDKILPDRIDSYAPGIFSPPPFPLSLK